MLRPSCCSTMDGRAWCNSSHLHCQIVLPSLWVATNRFQITSFNGQPLHIKHATNRLVRLQHLPIFPSPRHPDLGQLLEIDGDPLPKNSYVKIEKVRFCTHQDIRPWGGRKLSSDSYILLMQYAGAKPQNADRPPVQRQSRRQRRYLDALSPYVASKRPPSMQKLTHGNATTDHRTTSPTYTRLPRPHYIRQKPVDRLREPLLPSYYRTSAPHQSTYRTFRSPNRTSRNPMMPLRRPTPARNEKASLRACAVVLILCVVLFAIAAAAYNLGH